jgi:hypothetical protein
MLVISIKNSPQNYYNYLEYARVLIKKIAHTSLYMRILLIDYRIIRFFKGAVAGLIEDTIFEDEVLAVAERLGAGNAATNEAQVARVPTEVLAI